MYFYKEKISSYNHTAHKVLTNEISLILLNFPEDQKRKTMYNWFLNNRFHWINV